MCVCNVCIVAVCMCDIFVVCGDGGMSWWMVIGVVCLVCALCVGYQAVFVVWYIMWLLWDVGDVHVWCVG